MWHLLKEVDNLPKKKNYRQCLTTPFETGIRNFASIAKFFMYYAPGIDSEQRNGDFSENVANNIFGEMIHSSGMREGRNAVIQTKIFNSSWKKLSLEDEKLDFEEARFLCDKYRAETDLHALLRHIRNALAHGTIYVWKKKQKGSYIFLVDLDPKKNKITAKIMVSSAILENWKAIIENEIAIGE